MPELLKRLFFPVVIVIVTVSCSKQQDHSSEQMTPEPVVESSSDHESSPTVDTESLDRTTPEKAADGEETLDAMSNESPPLQMGQDKLSDEDAITTETQKKAKSSWEHLHERWPSRDQSSTLDRFPLPSSPLSSTATPHKFPGFGGFPLSGKTNHAVASPQTPFSPPSVFPEKTPPPDPKSSVEKPVPVGRTDVIPTITLLCYHQFDSSGLYSMSTEEFRHNLEEIRRRGYTVVPLVHVIEYYQGKRDTLPEKSLVITIDDGYRSVYKHAYPLLKEFGYPWVFYIYPDFVGSGAGAVTWEQLQEMAANGMELGCHSMSHSNLTSRKGKNQEDYDAWLEKEIVASRRTIEEKTGLPVPSFSYPYGAFNPYVREKTIAAGYGAITTVIHANNYPHSDPMELNRFVLTKTYSIERALDNADNTQALPLRGLSPGHGSQLLVAPERISAVLPEGFAGDPDQVAVTVAGQSATDFSLDPDSRILTITNLPPHLSGKVTVKISAPHHSTGAKQTGTWYFYIQSTESTAAAAENAIFSKQSPQCENQY